MEYRLRWDTFQKWTKESIQDWYKDSEYTDLTLLSDDMQVFKSHRIILSSSSDFFKQILGKMKSFKGQTLYLKEIQGCVLGLLLRFIYEGEVTVTQELLPNFLSAAVDLQIKGINFEDHKDLLEKKNETLEHCASLEEIENEITESEIKEELQCQEDVTKKRERPKKKSKSQNSANKDILDTNSEESLTCGYDTCDQTFKSIKEAKKHIMKSHGRPIKEKNFNCNSCDKKFPTKHEAKGHWLFRHGNGEKKFSCGSCDKKFFQRCDLNMHMKGVHLKIKDFHCSFCDLSFSQKCNLKTHKIKMHTDDFYDQLNVKLE